MAFILNSLGLTGYFNSSNAKEENMDDKIKSDGVSGSFKLMPSSHEQSVSD